MADIIAGQRGVGVVRRTGTVNCAAIAANDRPARRSDEGTSAAWSVSPNTSSLAQPPPVGGASASRTLHHRRGQPAFLRSEPSRRRSPAEPQLTPAEAPSRLVRTRPDRAVDPALLQAGAGCHRHTDTPNDAPTDTPSDTPSDTLLRRGWRPAPASPAHRHQLPSCPTPPQPRWSSNPTGGGSLRQRLAARQPAAAASAPGSSRPSTSACASLSVRRTWAAFALAHGFAARHRSLRDHALAWSGAPQGRRRGLAFIEIYLLSAGIDVGTSRCRVAGGCGMPAPSPRPPAADPQLAAAALTALAVRRRRWLAGGQRAPGGSAVQAPPAARRQPHQQPQVAPTPSAASAPSLPCPLPHRRPTRQRAVPAADAAAAPAPPRCRPRPRAPKSRRTSGPTSSLEAGPARRQTAPTAATQRARRQHCGRDSVTPDKRPESRPQEPAGRTGNDLGQDQSGAAQQRAAPTDAALNTAAAPSGKGRQQVR